MARDSSSRVWLLGVALRLGDLAACPLGLIPCCGWAEPSSFLEIPQSQRHTYKARLTAWTLHSKDLAHISGLIMAISVLTVCQEPPRALHLSDLVLTKSLETRGSIALLLRRLLVYIWVMV